VASLPVGERGVKPNLPFECCVLRLQLSAQSSLLGSAECPDPKPSGSLSSSTL
jgi:hypothetical protein